MATSVNLLDHISAIYDLFQETADPVCEEVIDPRVFYQFLLIPAILVMGAIAFTKRRQNILLDFLKGRPGLVHPMNALTRSDTISYACAFGATSYLVYGIVINKDYAVDRTNDANYMKAFYVIASMIVYGITYLPVFTSLASASVVGLGLGIPYMWLLTGYDLYRLTECRQTAQTRAVQIVQAMPGVLCHLYLCVMMPVRMFKAFRRGHYVNWAEDYEDAAEKLEEIRDSYTGQYVAKLLTKTPVLLPSKDETKKQKALRVAGTVFSKVVYRREKGFRYPSRLMSVMFVAVIVVYVVTAEFLELVPLRIEHYRDAVQQYVDDNYNDTSTEEDVKEALNTVWWALSVLEVCLITAVVLACICTVFNVLHSMSCYRKNLHMLYRGDHSFIPALDFASNPSHMNGFIKFAGFQVGYIVWSFMILAFLLSFIAFSIAVVVLLVTKGYSDWLVTLLDTLWPVVLIALFVTLGQTLMARFLFLQGKAEHLALDNRSFFFVVTYFLFFYNIFLGLISCIIRILLAMAVGILFLSRLDNSTLPRRFEFIDPGFKAYVGFLHVEASHTHPVMLTFARLLRLGLREKRAREAGAAKAKEAGEVVVTDEKPKKALKENESDDKRHRKSMAARQNWHVTYTLLHNPDIRVMRKGYVQLLRKARMLGVAIPVSDTKAEVDIDKLSASVAQAQGTGTGNSKVEEAKMAANGVNGVDVRKRGGKSEEKKKDGWKNSAPPAATYKDPESSLTQVVVD